MMGSPLPIATIGICYVIFIKVFMTRFMESRKAYNTKYLSLTLNTYLFSTACYFFHKASTLAWFAGYNWRCEPLDRSNSPRAIEVSGNLT